MKQRSKFERYHKKTFKAKGKRCSNGAKITYDSFEEAVSAANYHKIVNNRKYVRAYNCKTCQKWHLTTKKKRRK